MSSLPHSRQDICCQTIELSSDPQKVDLAKPLTRYEATIVRESTGVKEAIQLYSYHLLCDENGAYPVELGAWQAVLRKELGRDSFKFCYCNPDRLSQDSLLVAYMGDDDTETVRPVLYSWPRKRASFS